MAKNVGVLLSGSGVFDGSEIHEAVLTLLFLDKAGANIKCMAPNMDQYHVINHLTNEEMDEKRNILVEAARIARGDIDDLKDIHASDLDALIIPGGHGAIKNLSDFAFTGHKVKVHVEVERLLEEMVSESKPVGAICIAPAPVTKALSKRNPVVTIGNDVGTAATIGTMGGKHENCTVDMICLDEKNNIVTTPAYMLGPSIKDIAVGIEKLVEKILSMIK